jgi:hypothetical protein
MPTTKPAKPAKPKPRATTVDRAERALERTSENEPTHTDDPARDKAEQDGSVIKPLPHSD